MFSNRTRWPLGLNRLTQLAEARRRCGDLIDLTVSNPTQCGFAYDRPRLLAALGSAAALRYEPHPLGLLTARRAVADYYAERGVEVPPERIVLTASTSEAYSHLLRLLCNPGDEVATPTPSYPLLDLLADINDVTLAAEAGPRTRARIVVHPNNPTGEYLQRAEWERLQGGGPPLIVDEVFFDFPVGPARPPALDYGAARRLTFVLNGLSKTAGLPQMKLAWMALFGPAAEVAAALARLEVLADTYLSVGTPIQQAVGAILAGREAIQSQIRARVAANLAALDGTLAAHPAVRRLPLEGGWSAVMRWPHLRPEDDWAEHLVEAAGVLTHPGHFYGFGTPGHLVVSLLPPEAEFRRGLARLGPLLTDSG